MIELRIIGQPVGKGRPRFIRATGRTYTPKETVLAENRVRDSWVTAGSPTLEGPLHMTVEAVLARPKNHWRVDGSLSAAGVRTPWPLRTPDLDNVWKLCADSLNKRAYRDDSQIVTGDMVRRWAHPGEDAHTRVVIDHVRAPGSVVAVTPIAPHGLKRAA